MAETDEITNKGFSWIENEEQWPNIDSKFRLIIVAALRSKQLQHGSVPRIEADLGKRKNTSIAIEEVKQGLVPYITINEIVPSLAPSPLSLSGIPRPSEANSLPIK